MTVAAYARALPRWRRGVATALVQGCPESVTLRDQGPTGSLVGTATARAVESLLDGRGTFDVARARAYALDLIALEDEHAVFTDWTAAQGKGPDNREPGAFGPSNLDICKMAARAQTRGLYQRVLQRRGTGGWPGKLAREWGTVPCVRCRGTRRSLIPDPTGGIEHPEVWCPPCKGTGRQPRLGADRRAPMGRSLARVGRRLLLALKGQPDECQAGCFPDLDGVHVLRRRGPVVIEPDAPLSAGGTIGDCDSCHGTGHNLAGKLPALRPSPQVCWRRADQGLDEHGVRTGPDTWLDDPDITGYMHPGWGCRTDRVVPRGEHRRPGQRSDVRFMVETPWHPRTTLGLRLENRGYQERMRRPELAPRWRRGELRHAQQRRERAKQRDVDEVREEWSFGELDERAAQA